MSQNNELYYKIVLRYLSFMNLRKSLDVIFLSILIIIV